MTWAEKENRTLDLITTNDVLYQLSYFSNFDVPNVGLEPTRLSTLVPKTSLATNYSNWAFTICLYS